MSDKARIRIAAAVTALFLAALSTAGLAMRSDGPPHATVAAPAATAASAAQAVAGPAVEREEGEEGEDDE